MPGPVSHQLSLTWTEAWLTVVTAVGIYLTMILLSRLFGQRQLTTSSSYDLAFVFALGSVMGRVILVRTSLPVAALGLATLFVTHAAIGWLHHHIPLIHRLIQNPPVLVVAHGRFLDDNIRRARTSRTEIFQHVRLEGLGTVGDVSAAVLERSGKMTVITTGTELDPECFDEVVGSDALWNQRAAEPLGEGPGTAG